MVTTENLRSRTTGHLLMVSVAVACGITGALGAVVFRFMIRLVQTAFFEGASGIESLFDGDLLGEGHNPLASARGVGGRNAGIPAEPRVSLTIPRYPIHFPDT